MSDTKLLNKRLIQEFLDDKYLENNLLFVIQKYVKKSDENLLTVIGWFQLIISSRLIKLNEMNSSKWKAIEGCFNFINKPTIQNSLGFFQLWEAAKNLFPTANPLEAGNSESVNKTFKQFVKFFKKVENKIDDEWIKITQDPELPIWIKNLKEFLASEKGRKWLSEK